MATALKFIAMFGWNSYLTVTGVNTCRQKRGETESDGDAASNEGSTFASDDKDDTLAMTISGKT